MGSDYYNVLGIPFDATPEEVRSAYFEAARRLHPDANPDPAAREVFLNVQQAYEILRHEHRRAEYDSGLPPQVRARAAVSLSAKFSRSAIPLMDEQQLFYVLLDVTCTAEPDPARIPPVSLCVVLDRSTSMQGQRLDMVRENILQMLGKLRPQDVFSLVTFSDRAEVLIPPTRVANLGRVEALLLSVQPGGSTEIYRGMQLGVDLLRRCDSKMSRYMVFMTDGHTYGDEGPTLALARDAADEGILIHVLGIGHEWNDVFLDQITSTSGGTTTFVTSNKDLQLFVEQKLNAIEVLYARGLQFHYQVSEDVTLQGAFRVRPDIAPLPLESPVPLGNLHHGKNLSILLEFLVPSLPPGKTVVELANGAVRMDVPTMTISKTRILFDLKRSVQVNFERETPPRPIVDAMSRLTLYRIQEKARIEVGRGNLTQATRHLHHLATHLLAKGERELAHTVLMEAEHIQQTQHFSEEGDKRIKYGTRGLLLLPSPEQRR